MTRSEGWIVEKHPLGGFASLSLSDGSRLRSLFPSMLQAEREAEALHEAFNSTASVVVPNRWGRYWGF